MFRSRRDSEELQFSNLDTIDCKEFPPTDEFPHGTLIYIEGSS